MPTAQTEATSGSPWPANPVPDMPILKIRGVNVMLDVDLARLYSVETRTLNQSVKRNQERFPEDFRFQLTRRERDEVITICDHLKKLKFSA